MLFKKNPNVAFCSEFKFNLVNQPYSNKVEALDILINATLIGIDAALNPYSDVNIGLYYNNFVFLFHINTCFAIRPVMSCI